MKKTKSYLVFAMFFALLFASIAAFSACDSSGTSNSDQEQHTHDYKIDTEEKATCLKEGKIVKKCDCGNTITEVIDIAEHTYGQWMTVNVSCTENGTQERKCSVCGYKETKTVSAAGHTYGEWKTTATATCSVAGSQERVCSVCGYKEAQSVIATGHNYGKWEIKKEPTCSVTGIREQVCSVCKHTVSETIGLADHSFGKWETKTESTCTSNGERIRVCANCDYTEREIISSVPHTIEIEEAVAATCTTKGRTEGKRCSVCKTVLVASEEVSVGSHKYGDWKITTNATCSTEGEKERTCAGCNETQTQTIAKTPHTVVTDAFVAATCTTKGKTEGKHCSACNEIIAAPEEIPAVRTNTESG